MASEEDKTIQKLVKALDTTYGSAGKVFWRSFLAGLGRGIGSLVAWLLLLAVIVYLFKISGLTDTFRQLQDSVSKLGNSVRSLPGH